MYTKKCYGDSTYATKSPRGPAEHRRCIGARCTPLVLSLHVCTIATAGPCAYLYLPLVCVSPVCVGMCGFCANHSSDDFLASDRHPNTVRTVSQLRRGPCGAAPGVRLTFRPVSGRAERGQVHHALWDPTLLLQVSRALVTTLVTTLVTALVSAQPRPGLAQPC